MADKQDKQIQIPYTLFTDMVQYILLDRVDLKDQCEKGIKEKLEANVRRELYTKYKTAATEEQKEKARQEYLERVGIPKNFRW